ncbi:MAG: hypothetical protein A3K10_10650 [Bacteroidetes bacterium RIFCSPLOWO2_12_FULL_31_6]|nr:MAG: hypothetical protein A3K10_10650 [Bacteroidetes bacterium RIFCSPLOWO2_12_FULL_31_6]
MEVIKTIEQYKRLALDKVVDYTKYNQHTLSFHSTALEGSTLTETETYLLLDEGITPKGKKLEDSLMVKDHYQALLFTLQVADKNEKITVELIKKMNAEVLKSTGKMYYTALGDIDSTKGELRKGNVRAGNRYFPNYDKVPKLLEQYCLALNEHIKITNKKDVVEQLKISFSAHYNLVSIHPFYDGNGRTSRLMMNFIQQQFKLPLAIVDKEDRNEYIEVLEKSRKTNEINYFYDFMFTQYIKFLKNDMDKYIQQTQNKNKKDSGMNFLW